MTVIDPERTLADLVLENPARVSLFEELQLDYCCGGQSSLGEVAAQRGLDPRTLALALEAAERTGVASSSCSAERDWQEAPLSDLCDHIVDVHHAFLRRELPAIGERLGKVAAKHGAMVSSLIELEKRFDELSTDLLEHIDQEEQGLFPLCRSLDEDVESGEDFDTALVARRLAMHEHAHAEVGKTLAVMRELGGGYRPETALCTTHRLVVEALDRLERDLHRHIHEENNILFPRLRARCDEAAAPLSGHAIGG
jgi:regulator of cell morphogenesis and NO signaling